MSTTDATLPLFSATPVLKRDTTSPKAGTQTQPAVSSNPITGEPQELFLRGYGEDQLRIINWDPHLPVESTVSQRNALVKAGGQSSNLPEDGWRTISRALLRPEAAAKMVSGDLLPTETVAAYELDVLPGYVVLPHVLTITQPRTGATASAVPPPTVRGEVDAANNPVAVVVMTFKDHNHLRSHLKQVVRETRATGNDYVHSILARRISREVIAHVARIEFADGSEPLWVLSVRDGITRVVSAWAATMEPGATADDVADHMADQLLTPRDRRRGAKPLPDNQLFAQGRDAVAARMRAMFAAGTVEGGPSADAIRIRQAFALPARIYVGVHPGARSPLPPGQVFDDAVRAVVGSVHVEFKGWEPAAGEVEIGERALHRVQYAGLLSSKIVDLALGTLDANQTAAVFDDPNIPNTPLWRAVYLVAALCNRRVFEAMKRELRDLTGLTRINDPRFISILAPIVDRPWRASKSRTLNTARRAWTNEGPIPHEILRQAWTPVPAAHFVDLVPSALQENREAIWTLQVAGGIALVADKLITSNVGSKFTSGQVPFRANVDVIVSGLGQSEAGLWLLARAADAFQADRLAINSFTSTDLKGAPELAKLAYRVPAIDPDNPSALLIDGSGAPRPLTEHEVVRCSDPERAAEEDARQSSSVLRRPVEEAVDLRRRITTGLTEVQSSLKRLVKIADVAAFVTHDEWQRIFMLASEIQVQLQSTKPTSSDPSDDDGSDPSDDDGEEA